MLESCGPGVLRLREESRQLEAGCLSGWVAAAESTSEGGSGHRGAGRQYQCGELR